MGGKFSAFAGLLLIFGLFRSSLSQTYLCNGQSYNYAYPGCTYGNTGLYGNSGLYGNTGLYGLGTYNNPYTYSNSYASSYYPYNNYNSGGLYGYNNYGSSYGSGTQYLCNGVLSYTPNPACTYNTFGK